MSFVFRSSVGREHREAIEQLLFFNPQQNKAREGILYSLDRFGAPRIEETSFGLTVRSEDHEAQTIFAYKKAELHQGPVGVVVFLRSDSHELGIMHIAVRPEYSQGGCYGPAGLTFLLIDEVRSIGRRIKGVERVVFFYHGEHGLPI